MTWWFHLLVRRVESLRERVDVFERVTQAVGSFCYAGRCEPILMRFHGHTWVVEDEEYAAELRTVNHVMHGYGDVPSRFRCSARRDTRGRLYVCVAWVRNGEHARSGGKPCSVGTEFSSRSWRHIYEGGDPASDVIHAELLLAAPDVHRVLK